jgi:hypothetical protein
MRRMSFMLTERQYVDGTKEQGMSTAKWYGAYICMRFVRPSLPAIAAARETRAVELLQAKWRGEDRSARDARARRRSRRSRRGW